MKITILNFCIFILLLVSSKAQSQYANGTGTGLHQSQIFWLKWGGSKLVSTPAAFTSTDIVEGTYIWDLEPGLVRVVGELSNIASPVKPINGVIKLAPYSSGTYVGGNGNLGDGLQVMYPGVNPVGIATHTTEANLNYKKGVVQFDISLKLQMLIDGNWTDLNYPGMVIADAESMASSSAGTEYISAETSGKTGWQILDVHNNAASIKKDPTNYKLQIANGGKYFKLYNNLVNNIGVQAVMFAQGTKTLKNVQMQGEGTTALALGFIAPFDYGDAPASYGEVTHYMDNLALNGTPMTVDGIYSVTSQKVSSSIVPTANIYINELPDADGGLNHFSENADVDGATTIPDYDGSGSYTLTLPITNKIGLPSNLGAWIDWNQNGAFDESEAVFVTTPASATTATFTWTGLTTSPNPAQKYYVRARITTDRIISPNLGATNGEVEDYVLNIATAISGHVFNDANGLANDKVDGPGTNVSGALYVNLVNQSGHVVASTPVASNGYYAFGGTSSGNYTLQLSVQQGVVGSPAPAVVLPSQWVSTGEVLGTAPGHDGTVNAILPLTITFGESVTNANFGIEQTPTSDNKRFLIPTPVLNSSIILDGRATALEPLSGLDPEDGVLSANRNVTITNIDGMNGNELYYNGVLIQVGMQIKNYDPKLLSIKFTTLGSTTVNFEYAFSDTAGQLGISGKYVIVWNGALPVTLVSFTANKEGQMAVLNWQTALEINSDYFLIQRSTDGKVWHDLASINALGDYDELKKYTFTDNTPALGTNMYRLKMVDKDGTYAHSRIQPLSFSSDVSLSVYPNPVSDILYIREAVLGTVKQVAIYNIQGQKMYQSNTAGTQSIPVNTLASGIYMIKVIHADGATSSHKIFVNH